MPELDPSIDIEDPLSWPEGWPNNLWPGWGGEEPVEPDVPVNPEHPTEAPPPVKEPSTEATEPTESVTDPE